MSVQVVSCTLQLVLTPAWATGTERCGFATQTIVCNERPQSCHRQLQSQQVRHLETYTLLETTF